MTARAALVAALGATLVALLAPAAPARAQGTGAVGGTVHDSLAGAPLAGAAVQLVAAGDPARTWSARTDSAGAYRVAGLAAGRYYVGFHHPRLDALGLREPVRQVAVPDEGEARADLAVPSAAALRAAACDADETDVSGLVLGRVHDADRGTPAADAEVVVMWVEARVDEGGRQLVRREQAVPVGADGRYAICGVPSDVPVAVLARADTAAMDDASGLVPVPLEPRGVAVRDLALGRGDAARLVADGTALPVRRGTAALAGTVYFQTGAPYDGATVLVHGTAARDTTGRGGQFTFADLPAGTQTVLVHAMGYEPRRVPVTLASGRTDSVAIVLGERSPVIERVTIVGRRPYGARDGFLRRRARGLGYTLDSAEIAQRAPRSVADLLRAAPDVRIDLGLFEESIQLRGCAPHVWLDGAYLRGGARDASFIVDTRLLGALEVYPTLRHTPSDFVRIGAAMTMGGDCGAVLLWTHEVLRG